MRLNRLVGIFIFGATLLAAVALIWAIVIADPERGHAPSRGVLFGLWEVFYATEAPSLRVIVAAGALALLFAAGVAALERRIANRARRRVPWSGGV